MKGGNRMDTFVFCKSSISNERGNGESFFTMPPQKIQMQIKLRLKDTNKRKQKKVRGAVKKQFFLFLKLNLRDTFGCVGNCCRVPGSDSFLKREKRETARDTSSLSQLNVSASSFNAKRCHLVGVICFSEGLVKCLVV